DPPANRRADWFHLYDQCEPISARMHESIARATGHRHAWRSIWSDKWNRARGIRHARQHRASRQGRGPRCWWPMRSAGVGDGALLLLAEALDAEPHGLPGLEPDRVRLDAHADAGRRARRDDVARLQAHELADVVHEMADAKDH